MGRLVSEVSPCATGYVRARGTRHTLVGTVAIQFERPDRLACVVVSRIPRRMDDIAEFEALMLPAVKADVGTDTEPLQTPTKRSAGSSTIPGDKSDSKSFKRRKSGKLEFPDEDDHEDGSPADGLDPVCLGCGRGKRSGRDFADPGRPVTWAFTDGRGQWCRECHTTWRTAFSGSHTLSLFGAWIRVPENLRTFHTYLLAYITLAQEDKKHITAGMIVERTLAISFALKLLGIPQDPCVLLMVEDAVGDSPPTALPSEPNANNLFTVRTSMGDRLALMVPECVDPNSATAFQRPQSPDGPLFGVSRHFLSTSSAVDKGFLQDKFDIQTMADESTNTTGTSAKSVNMVRPQLSKLEAKFDVLTVTSTAIVDAFSRDQWEVLKESAFTKIVRDLAQFKSEAEAVANMPTIEKSDLWLAGMLAGKRFVKQHKDYSKCKAKHSRLAELASPMSSLRTFLVSTAKLNIAPSFQLLMHKATFMHKFEESNSLSDAIEALVNDGIASTFEKAKASDNTKSKTRFSAEIFLRGIVFHVVGILFCEEARDTVGISAVHSQLRSARDCLTQSEACAESLAGLIEDLNALAMILGCAVGHKSPTVIALNSAVKRLASPHFATFVDKVKDSEMYKTGTSSASNALQISSKDGIADDKLDRAIAILRDTRHPHIKTVDNDNGSSLMFLHFDAVRDMSVADSLGESMTKVAEACQLWSPLRAEQRAAEVGAWAADVSKQIGTYDAGLTMFAFATLQGGSLDCLENAATDDGAIVWPDVKSLISLAGCIENHFVDEQPLLDFNSRFVSFLRGLPPHFAANVKMHQQNQVHQAFRDNSSARTKVMETLLAIVDIHEGPGATDVAVDDFLAKHSTGKSEASMLFKVCKFLSHVFELDGHTMRDTHQHCLAPSDKVVFPTAAGDADTRVDLAVAMAEASKITHKITQMKVVSLLKIFVQDSIQPIFERFVASLHVAAIVPKPRPDLVTDESLPVLLGNFYIQNLMSDHLLTVGKIFGSKKQKGWVCDDLRQLCEKLVAVLPDGAFSVSLRSLCRRDASTEPHCTSKVAFAHLCKVLALLSKVASSFAFVDKQFSSKEGIIREHILKSEVEAAADLVRSCITSGLEIIDDKQVAWSTAFPAAAYSLEIPSVRSWFEAALGVAMQMCKALHTAACQAALDLSLEVDKMTPRCKHFITDATVNVTMVRRHVLGSPHRDMLGPKSITLFGAIQAATALKSQWFDLVPSVAGAATTSGLAGDDAEGGDTDGLGAANNIFEQAREAIVITGACKVIFELTGEGQKSQACGLLDGRRNQLPESLITMLEKKAGRASGSMARRPSPASAAALAPTEGLAKEEPHDE